MTAQHHLVVPELGDFMWFKWWTMLNIWLDRNSKHTPALNIINYMNSYSLPLLINNTLIFPCWIFSSHQHRTRNSLMSKLVVTDKQSEMRIITIRCVSFRAWASLSSLFWFFGPQLLQMTKNNAMCESGCWTQNLLWWYVTQREWAWAEWCSTSLHVHTHTGVIVTSPCRPRCVM